MEDFLDDFEQRVTEAILQAAPELMRKAEGSSFPLRHIPGYDSANDIGVQLPGPIAGVGEGQDVPWDDNGFGEDMREIAASSPTSITGVQLPGAHSWEPGYTFGEDHRDEANVQDVPIGLDFGDTSDMGSAFQAHGDEPGMSVIGRLPADQFDVAGTWGGPNASEILPAFDRIRDRFSMPNEGTFPGMDSMRGLPLGDGSGIVGGEGYMGEDGYLGAGDGDNDQDDYNRYPEGDPFQPAASIHPQGGPVKQVVGRRSM